jgi:hypothetical protein
MKIHLVTLFAPRLDFYYIEDWIKHNLNLGVDHIYFYNNGFNLASEPTQYSNKVGPIAEKVFGDKGCSGEISKGWDLKPHIDHFLEWTEEEIDCILNRINDKYPNVTFIPFEYNVHHLSKYPESQWKAMLHHIQQGRDSDWLAMLDIDEYINLGNHSNLKDFINYIGTKGDYDNIALAEAFQKRIYRESFTKHPNDHTQQARKFEYCAKKTFCKTSLLFPLKIGAAPNRWYSPGDIAWSNHKGCTWYRYHEVTTYDCDKNEAYYNHYKSDTLYAKDKILCCILHTEKQPEQYEAIEKTWGSRIDHMYYSDHEDVSKNIVKVSDNSDYKSCVEKNARVFKVLINDDRYKNYDYYFFVDNDTYVNEVKLKSCIIKDNFNEDKIYSEPLDKAGRSWAHGGAGYLMNKKVLEKFEHCEILPKAKHSDTNVSQYAFKQGVQMKHFIGLNACCFIRGWNYTKKLHLEELKKRFPAWNEQITLHYIRGIDNMEYIQNEIKKQNTKYISDTN